MGKYTDDLIMLIAGILIVIWLYRLFYRWLHEPAGMKRLVLGKGGRLDPGDENILFLEQEGYAVTSGKHRLPLTVMLDGQPLQSRLYIDYIAEKNGDMFAVRTARERMPMDWTGSGIRDRLLVYALLLPELSGVIYVDAKSRVLRTITFEFDEE